MSDHVWSLENIEAFVTGGLSAEEAERLETHTRDCPDCAAAVAAARRIDRGLGGLFADLRPDFGLEDRAIASTRLAPRRALWLSFKLPRLAIAAGVMLVLATIGAMVGALITDARLPLPGETLLTWAAPQSAPAPESDRALREAPPPSAETKSAAGGIVFGGYPAQGQNLSTAPVLPQGFGPGQSTGFGFPQQPSTSISGGISGGITGGISGIGGGGSGGFGNPYGGAPAYYGSNTYTGGTTTANTNVGGTTIISGGTTFDALAQAPAGGRGSGLSLGTNNTVTFQPGSSNTIRGVPLETRVISPSLTTGAIQFGGVQSPAVNMPVIVATADPAFRPGEHRPAAQPGPAQQDPKHAEPGKDAKEAPAKPEAPKAAEPESATHRVVIRSGDMEFEVDSFDAATATITKQVANIKGAFVATVNSDKLANGKVRGSITVRTPPEHLDQFVLDLRKELGATGALKGMKIASQDITKQYTDLESRSRAARTMEQRLLQIIKEGKGEIKQLLEAERELGIWRTKIEEFEGELRYYNNLAALATLTITLTEKEIRQAAAVSESERVQAGIEVEDVDKAYQQALAAITEAKGRVTKSEVKQLAAGQFNATMQFEVPPDAAGPMRDRLKQLGRLARLEIDRVQRAEGGTLPPDGKVKRGDAVFLVQIYNLANVAPRETASLQFAVADVRVTFQTLRDAATKAAARVRTAQLNEPDANNISAQLDVEIKRADEGAFRAALDGAGEVLSRQVTRAPEGDEFTDTKVLYRVMLLPAARLAPRETATLQLAAADVRAAFQALRDAAAKTAARVRTAQLNEQDAQNVTGQFDVEIKRADEAQLRAALESAGEVISRQVMRAPEGNESTDSRLFYRVTLTPADRLAPRETAVMTLEVQDVDQTAARFAAQVAEVKGRQLNAETTRDRSGKVTAKLTYEVPLAAASLPERFKSAGTLRGYQSTRNPQAPAGKYATARIEATLVSGEQIVTEGEGLWPQVRRGLSYSVAVLLTSVTWLVFGLCVVLPWGVVVYAGYRMSRWLGRGRRVAPVTPPVQG